ncbi:hypothetical protein ACWDKQ_23385 [Saccharopolyspora sp. NPDC000995]
MIYPTANSSSLVPARGSASPPRGLAADLTDPATPRRLTDYAREQCGPLDGLFVSPR